MYTRYYPKHDPPPVYHHECGQPIELREHTTGYSTWDLTIVDGEAVRDCPTCGKRIWRESLIHPRDWEWEEYLDEKDTIRCLEPTL